MAKSDIFLTNPMKDATVAFTVHLTRRYHFRLWLGIKMLRLAARVLGVNTVEFHSTVIGDDLG